MAAPGTLNPSLYQGDTAVYTLTLTRTDASGVTAPVDLTGASGLAQIRRSVRDAGVLATFDVTFPDAAAGKVRLELTAESSQALRPGTFVWDLQITTADDVVKTWLAGSVTVTAGVSR